MTQPEIDALALRVGITQEKFPEFWDAKCPECGKTEHDPAGWYEPDTGGAGCNFLCCGDFEGPPQEWVCNLPDPASDDPRAVLWESFLMRALGWPLVYLANDKRWRVANEIKSLTRMTILGAGATPTAALLAAYQAKEATDATH
jgi:hypothetical protein